VSTSALAEEKAAAAAAAVVGAGTLEEKAAAAVAAEAAVEKAAALRAKDHKSLLSSTKDVYFQVRACLRLPRPDSLHSTVQTLFA
jgi:hypothetical protein